MNLILVLCVVILCHEKTSLANTLRADDLGKSSLSTEYEARFLQLHPDGLNTSEGNIQGRHRFEKETDQEPWESFASKCARVIHGLVSALANAVVSEPGDATNLQLDIRNHIFHHDNRVFNTCKPAGFLTDCENDPSSGQDGSIGQAVFPPSPNNIQPSENNCGSEGSLGQGLSCDDAAQQLPQSEVPIYPLLEQLPMEAYPTPEPTMNTPATHEIPYEATTPAFSPLLDPQNPINQQSDCSHQCDPIDNSSSFSSEALPQDNWKPAPSHQTDLIPPDSTLMDDTSTSPHLATGLATPSSFTGGNPLPGNESPEFPSGYNHGTYPGYIPPPSSNDYSPNIIPSDSLVTPVQTVTEAPQGDCCSDDRPQFLPPIEAVNDSNILPGNVLGAPTDTSQGECCDDLQPENLPPADALSDTSGMVPNNNLDDSLLIPATDAPQGECCVPEDQPESNFPAGGIADPSGMMPDIGNGNNFGLPAQAGFDSPLEESCSDDQPQLLDPADGLADTSDIIPGNNFGDSILTPGPPVTDASQEECCNDNAQPEYPPPVEDTAYPFNAIPDSGIANNLGSATDPPQGDIFGNEQPQTLPPAYFNGDPSGFIPSDSLVTPSTPVSDPILQNPYLNQQPGYTTGNSFNDGFANRLPNQNMGTPINSGSNALGNANLRPFGNQQTGQLPPVEGMNDPLNTIPDSSMTNNLGSPALSPFNPPRGEIFDNEQPQTLPPASFNSDPSGFIPSDSFVTPITPVSDSLPQNGFLDQKPRYVPENTFNEGLTNRLPNQNMGTPINSGSNALGNANLRPFGNQQTGQLPPAEEMNDPLNTIPGNEIRDVLGAPTTSAINPPQGDIFGNEQPQTLPPASFNSNPSGFIPSDSLVTPSTPVSDPVPQGGFLGQQPGYVPENPFNEGFTNRLPNQNMGTPINSGSNALGNANLRPFGNQQIGQLPPVEGMNDPLNTIPDSSMTNNLGSPALSPFNPPRGEIFGNEQPQTLPPASFNSDPSGFIPSDSLVTPSTPVSDPIPQNGFLGQQPGYVPGNPFNEGLTNRLPNQNMGTPINSGSNALGNANLRPFGNQQIGQLPPVFNDVPLNDLSDQNAATGISPVTPNSLGNSIMGTSQPPQPQPDFNSYNNDPGLSVTEPSSNENCTPESDAVPENNAPGFVPGNGNAGGPMGFPGFINQSPNQGAPGNNMAPENASAAPTYDDIPEYYNPDTEYQGLDDYNQDPDNSLETTPPGYQNRLGQNGLNQAWPEDRIYQQPNGYDPASVGSNSPVIYIPIGQDESSLLHDDQIDPDSDESCACDDCYEEDIVDHKAFCKTACRDLEQARNELKAIFDKIKKKLKCTHKG